MTLSAIYVVRNEAQFLRGSIELVLPYMDSIIIIDMESQDKTLDTLPKSEKIKVYSYPYSEPIDMGKARTFSLSKCTSDWFLQVDADEYYPPESMKKIREFVDNPGNAISARVPYHNISWRHGYKQILEHYPDRLYKTDVVEKYEGLLPNDMTIVKEEFRECRHKGKGIEGVLEYDNPDDRSFEHPRQPIIQAPFFHLARTRGFNFEFNKWRNYNKNLGMCSEEELDYHTRKNQWVNGLYPMEKIEVPDYIPTNNILNPKVSIIIPCYNKGEFISECVQSALNQSYAPFEVIVVDDGSTDNSRAEIAKFDVIQINQSNQGVATARNNGLSKATGDYFILLDGDDKLHAWFIEECLYNMKDDVQIIYTDCVMIGEWNWTHQAPEPEGMRTAQVVPSTMALCDMRILDPYGNFKSNVKTFEDAEFWLNCYYNRKMNFKHIPEPLCYYRRTQGSRIDYLNETAKERYKVLNDMYKNFNVHYEN